ncbi:MAG: hypothetical protein GF398_17305 [Chitinivibrionales bacterium]|nr:hypothetical protein [Chitinivibrionales bacterium]
MKRFHGIIATEDGRYTLAVLEQRNNKLSLTRTKTWDSHKTVHNALLLNTGVVLGIAAYWQSDRTLFAEAEHIQATGGFRFNAVCQPAPYNHHKEILASNIVAVAPDDAYLATIPNYFADSVPESYLAISPGDGYFKIGVVYRRQLVCVYNMAPAYEESLAGHLARIERYLKIRDPQLIFPHTICWLSSEKIPAVEESEVVHIPVDQFEDTEVMQAAGLACLQVSENAVPRFSGPTFENNFRRMRAGVYLGGVVLFLIAVLLLIMPLGLNAYTGWQLQKAKAQYEEVLLSNKEIGRMVSQNKQMAEKILRMNNTFARQTNWSQFLEAIGTERPRGVYFDRLGTKTAADNTNAIDVALTGWTDNEKSIMEFVNKLQKKSFLSNINPSSIQRDKKNTRLIRFKVMFRLILQ